MTESNDQTDKTLRAGARKPLSLQRTVESGHVRQNFSHGRSKSVVVEKKKTRKLGGDAVEAAPVPVPATVFEKPKPQAKPQDAPSDALSAVETRSGGQQRNLSNEERDARRDGLRFAQGCAHSDRIRVRGRGETTLLIPIVSAECADSYTHEI